MGSIPEVQNFSLKVRKVLKLAISGLAAGSDHWSGSSLSDST